jgi:hypothetical protein
MTEINDKLKMQIIIELMCQEYNLLMIVNRYEVSLPTLIDWKRKFMLEINQNIRNEL